MRRVNPKLSLLAATLSLSTLGAGVARADDPEAGGFQGGLQTTFYNTYYFRGFAVFEEAFNLQPSLDLGYAFNDWAALNFNVWAAVPFENRDALKELRDEVDLTLDATFTPLDGLGVSVGAIVYILPTDPVFHTEEVYLGLGYTFDFGLSLKASVYGDLNEFKGAYFRFAPGYSLAMTEVLTLNAELFVSGTKYADVDAALTELGAQVGVSADVGSGISTTFAVLYNYNHSIETHLYAINFGARYSF